MFSTACSVFWRQFLSDFYAMKWSILIWNPGELSACHYSMVKHGYFFFPLKLLSDPQFWDSKSGAQAMQLPKVTYHYDSEQFLKFYPHSLSQKSSLSIIIYITLFFKYPHCSVPWNIQQWSQHRPQEQTQEGRRSSENRILFRVGSRLSLHLLSLCIKYLLDKQIGIVLTTGDEYQHCTYIISGREINSFYV